MGTADPQTAAESSRREASSDGLLDGVADVVEGVADVGAQSAGAADDGDGDEGGDQAILDGGRTRLVIQKRFSMEVLPCFGSTHSDV